MRCLVLLTSLALLATVSPLHAQLTWTNQTGNNALPAHLSAVAHDGTRFVAVGTNTVSANLATSTDGQTWTSENAGNPIGGELADVTHGEGLFVAVGRTGGAPAVVATSPDGSTWTNRTTTAGIGGELHAVAHNGTDFVAVGTNTVLAVLAHSSDGVAWTVHTSTANLGGALEGVVWGNGRWVAVGFSGGNLATVATSTDGIGWTDRTGTAAMGGRLWGVASDGAQFVAVGERTPAGGSTQALVLSSTDGISWTDHSAALGLGAILYDVAYADGLWIAVGGDGVNSVYAWSTDGVNWSAATMPVSAWIDGVAAGGGHWVAVGSDTVNGLVVEAPQPAIGGGTITLGVDAVELSSSAQSRLVGVFADDASTSWTATTNDHWIQLATPTGVGTDNLEFSVSANPGPAARSGTISVNGASLTVTQLAPGQPAVPVNVRAAYDASAPGVRVSWNAATGAMGYAVQRFDWATDTWTDLGTTGANPPLQFLDLNPPAGTGADYRVRALGPTTPSAWSATASVEVPPALPIDFSATALSSSQIVLTWSDSVGETAYTIERDDGTGFFETVARLPADAVKWVDVALPAGTSATYRLGVEGGGVYGRTTAPASAMTPAGSDSILWQRATTSLTHLFGVAYGAGRWVAVGTGGAITTSADAADWSAVASPASTTLEAVAFGGGAFVAVGASGTVLTSVDGLAWTAAGPGTSDDLVDVASAPGRFVAVSPTGNAWTATDPAVWTPLAVPTGHAWVSIDVVDGGFALVAADGQIFQAGGSATGWQPLRGPAPAAETPFFWTRTDLAASATRVVAAGPAGRWSDQALPLDAAGWSELADGSFTYLNAIAFGNGVFCGVGLNGRTRTTTDGAFWVDGDQAGDSLEAVAFGAGRFVAVGRRGLITTSTDGLAWQVAQPAEGTTEALFAVGSNANQTILVGNDTILRRAHGGSDWQPASFAVSGNPYVVSLHDVTWANGQWTVVGAGRLVLTSPDGSTWTTRQEGDFTIGNYRLAAAAYGLGRWVIAGDVDALYSSADGGQSWAPATPIGNTTLYNPTDLLFHERFSAVFSDFSSTTTYVSEDGHTWEYGNLFGSSPDLVSELAWMPVQGEPVRVGLGHSEYFGDGGLITGWDGRNWTGSDFTLMTGTVAGLAAGNGVFLAVSSQGELAASLDGQGWELAPTGFLPGFLENPAFEAVGFDGERFIAVGAEGLIVELEVGSAATLGLRSTVEAATGPVRETATGAWRSPLFGLFYARDWPWIYHQDHRWIYLVPTAGGLWAYDPKFDGGTWWWAEPGAHPWFYTLTRGWIYHVPGTHGPRTFYDPAGASGGPEWFTQP